jgi:hypothetical protein
LTLTATDWKRIVLSDSTNPRDPEVEELSPFEKDLMDKLFSNPRLWPDTAKVWIADYVSQNSLLPISQVQGFTQFTAKQDSRVLSSSTTSSTTYVDFDTNVELTGLSAGQYLLFYGGNGLPSIADGGAIAPSVNGATPDTAEAALYWGGNGPAGGTVSTTRALYKTLSESANTVKLQYKTDSSATFTVTFAFIIAIRIGNP